MKQACEGVDVAIACLGTGNNCNNYSLTTFMPYNIVGSELEREGHDRSDINLPGNQLQLLKDVSTVANCMLTHQGYLYYTCECPFIFSNYCCFVQCWTPGCVMGS